MKIILYTVYSVNIAITLNQASILESYDILDTYH